MMHARAGMCLTPVLLPQKAEKDLEKSMGKQLELDAAVSSLEDNIKETKTDVSNAAEMGNLVSRHASHGVACTC